MDEGIAEERREGAAIASFAALGGVAVVLGGLRGMPALPGMRFGGEWLLVSFLLGAMALYWRRAVVAEWWGIVRVEPVLVGLVVADALWTTIAVAWSTTRGPALAEAMRGWATSGSALLFVVVLRRRRWARTFCLAVLIPGTTLGIVAVGGAVASHFGWHTPFVEAAHHTEVQAWSRAAILGTPASFGALMLGVAGVAHVARVSGAIGLAAWRVSLAILGLAGAASVSIPGLGCVALVLWSLLVPVAARLALVAALALMLAATVVVYSHVHAVGIGDWSWSRPSETGYEPLGPRYHPLRTTRLGAAEIKWHWTGYARIHAAHLRTLRDHPSGMGTAAFTRVDTGPALRTSGRWSRTGGAHAWVLMRASEGGLVGFFIAVALWVWAGLRCVREGWRCRDAAGVAMAIAAFLWASWFGDFLHRWDVAVLAAAAVLWRERMEGPAGSPRIESHAPDRSTPDHAG